MADALSRYDQIFREAGESWNVDPLLLKSIARQESGGDPNATSSANAQGVMQIIPSTQRYLGVTDPRDPVQSIYGAAKYMNEALEKEGRPDLALLYYHGGPGWRGAYGPESQGYVPAVTSHYVKYSRGGPLPAPASPPAPAPTPEPGNPMAKKDDKIESDDDFLARTASKGGVETDDAFLKRTGAEPGGTKETATLAAPTGSGGIARNIAAGELEGVGETANALINPSGNVIGKPLATAIVFAHDALAPVIGYERFPDKVRNFLLGNEMELKPGTMAVEGIGKGVQAVTGGQTVPSEVPATTTGEQYARTAATGATMGAALGPNALAGALIGGAGMTGGKAAGDLAREHGYEWAAPMIELAGGVTAGAATGAAAMGLRPVANALAGAGRATAAGPEFFGRFAEEGFAGFGDKAKLRERIREAGREPPDAGGMPPPGAEGPSPGMGGPAPKSAGAAATPAYEAIHTSAEEAAYRATAEGSKLLEPQVIGERDLSQYIPGETVNNAEREQTVTTARELKELGARVPEASQIDKAAAESNNTARQIYARNTSKSEIDIHNRRTQRETDINADKEAVFAPENVTGPVDFAPVIEHMEAVLRAPENRQNSALQSAYREQLERIKSADITDPAEAWSLRRDIDRLTSKRMAAKEPNLHYVAGHLDEVAGLIDQQIQRVANGYGDMLGRYKEHSRAIDEMTVLQGMFDKLRGPGQKFTYNDFQRFMKNVVDSRSAPGVNPFKSISEENMTRLWNIRDSLRRSASALELARAAGSDTMPNIIDALRGTFKTGGATALHLAAGHLFGPGGNVAVQVLSSIIKNSTDRVQIRRAQAEMRRLMNPSEPLRPPPGQENPLSGAPPPP